MSINVIPWLHTVTFSEYPMAVNNPAKNPPLM